MAEKPPESAQEPAEAATPVTVDKTPTPTPTEPEKVVPRLHSFVQVVRGDYTGLLGELVKIEGDFALIRNRIHKTSHPELVSIPVDHVEQSDHTGGR